MKKDFDQLKDFELESVVGGMNMATFLSYNSYEDAQAYLKRVGIGPGHPNYNYYLDFWKKAKA